MTSQPWRVRFSAEADKDFVRILRYTRDTFGDRQAQLYKALLMETILALAEGPDAPGSAARDEISPGLRSWHVGRRGRPGRHVVMYRAGEGHTIEVARILHDAMDFTRHIPRSSAE